MMLQEELWHARLAEATTLQPENSIALWGAFCTQIEQRLLAGSSLYFPGLGAWELEEHREFVARTADGKYWLIPPRLTLRLVSESERSARSVSILLLAEILTQQTLLTPTLVRVWLEQISTLTSELLQQGTSITWPKLGALSPITDSEGKCTAYDFLPLESFLGQLNKPFSMFSPVEVSEDSIGSDLAIEEYATLEELYPLVAQRVSLVAPSVEATPLLEEPSLEETSSPETPRLIEQEELLPTPITEGSEPAQEVLQSLTPAPLNTAPAEGPQEALLLPQEGHYCCPSRGTTDAPEEATVVTPEERPRRLFWVILAGGILAGLVLLFLLLGQSSGGEKVARPLLPPVADSVPPASPAPQDTLASQDTLPQVTLDTLVSSPSEAPVVEPQPFPQANQAEQVRLHAGDRLSRLALKKYGHKAFWVYIYQENRGKLNDPDNIPVGITITLPPASKYQINAQDTNSVNKALLLQRSLLK